MKIFYREREFSGYHQKCVLLQRSTAVQIRSSVRLMPQNQPSGRGLLPSPTAWSSDQHPVAMLADVSRHTLSRTEGRGLGFGQLVRTHTGKCLKCQSSLDGLSDHNALCAGGRQRCAGPASVSIFTLSDNNRVVLQWVPAHVGIAGNETADRLAKAAAKLPQPHFSTTYREVKTLLKQKQKSAWRLRNNGYDPQKDQINTFDRRTQTTIFRLRTGHCGLRKHLKRLGLAHSAHCECGSEEQTPEHILQACPHLETARQQFWPEDTEVGTKLWGQAAELQRTADFLAATGLRI